MTNNPNPNEYIVDGTDTQPEPMNYAEMFRKARRLADVQEEINPRGPFLHMEDLLDKELVVVKLEFINAKKGPGCFIVMVDENGEITHTYTGSKGIVPKLRNIAEALPVICRFVEREGGAHGRFWDVE